MSKTPQVPLDLTDTRTSNNSYVNACDLSTGLSQEVSKMLSFGIYFVEQICKKVLMSYAESPEINRQERTARK